jgi:GNAT superfamily N-acetyltransferase
MSRPKLSIRPARKSELAAPIALYVDDDLGVKQEATEIDEAYQSAFGAFEADPNHMLVVGERDGKIVTTLLLSLLPRLSRHGAWRAQIEAMRVSGALRGQGIGQELLDWSVEKARQHGCTLVQLTSDRRRANAHRFYERTRFEPTHFGYKMSLETS